MVTIEEKTFNVEIEENNIEVVPVVIETEVIEVNTSTPGAKGDNATINGLNAINIVAGDNIELEQTEETLTINATGGTQLQSDMAQEDDTAIDYIKNKLGEYIETTLYIEEDDGLYPALTTNIDEMITMFYSIIIEIFGFIDYEMQSKQDTLVDEVVSLEPYEWHNNELLKYVSNISPNDKLWYSPDVYSYEDFVNSEIRMIEQGNGYVVFKCVTTPIKPISVVIRRAP